MVAPRISFNGDKVAKALADRIDRCKDLSSPLKAGAEAIKKLIDDSFKNGVSPIGTGPWQELKPSTIEHRRNKSKKILVDTSHLRANAFARAEGNSIVFGDNMVYAGPQQFGSEHEGEYSTKPLDDHMRHGPATRSESLSRALTKHHAGRAAWQTRQQRKNAELSRALAGNRFAGPKTRRRRSKAARFGPATMQQHLGSAQTARDRAGQPYSYKVPARPFLPVDKDGNFVKAGAAADVLVKIGRYVLDWIASGKKSR